MIEKFRVRLIATGLVLGAAFPAVLAEPGPGYPGGAMSPMMHGSMHGGGHHAGDGMRGSSRATRAFGLIYSLDLSDEQRSKVRKIEGDLRRKNWDAMGKVRDEKDKLRDLFEASPRDPKAIGAAYGAMFGYQRQMIEASIEALNRAEAVLTEAQRQQLKQLRRGPRPQGGMPGMGPGAPQGPAPR